MLQHSLPSVKKKILISGVKYKNTKGGQNLLLINNIILKAICKSLPTLRTPWGH